ncbi:MAG: GNAT family N-acetyltransferase [Mucinivorans sp.]
MEILEERALVQSALDLLSSSFPLCEIRPDTKHVEVLSDESFHPCHIYEQGQFIGLLYYWTHHHWCYVEHLATSPELRGRGMGALVIQWLQQQIPGGVIILEIEPPEDEITRRRQGFYLRQGFVMNHSYLHIHPSYRSTTEPHELKVMSYPRELTAEEFADFRHYSLCHIIKR